MVEHNFKWKNDGRLKIMIGCGTRPEIIRLAAVMKRCREYFDTCIVYYNQNWDRNLSTVFWEDFELYNAAGEIGPDILVPVVGENLGVTCGNILGRSYELLSELKPDGYPSMRQDALAGRKTEVELFAGTVVRLAEKHGISVPVNASYYKRIREKEEGLEKKTPSVDLNALAEDYLINGIEDFVEIMQDCREIWREKGPLADMPPEDFAQEVYKAMEKIPEERREYLLDFGL